MYKILEKALDVILGVVFIMLIAGIGMVFYSWYQLAHPVENVALNFVW